MAELKVEIDVRGLTEVQDLVERSGNILAKACDALRQIESWNAQSAAGSIAVATLKEIDADIEELDKLSKEIVERDGTSLAESLAIAHGDLALVTKERDKALDRVRELELRPAVLLHKFDVESAVALAKAMHKLDAERGR